MFTKNDSILAESGAPYCFAIASIASTEGYGSSS
jgi:hypothetical protein